MSTENNQTSESRPAATELMPAATDLRREVAVATSTPTTRADDKPDWEAKRGELKNCTMEPRKIKMVLNEDLICQILLWLPVISLLRLKHACRPWRALIESSYFIKQHLHRHHYDPSLKDKNHSLIYPLQGKYSPPFTFLSTSMEGFEEPNVCLQLNYSDDLHGSFPVQVFNIVSYNGILCLSILNSKHEVSICLWNPATKQSRVLPRSPFIDCVHVSVGFGYDIKSNDYKVVKIDSGGTFFAGKRFFEVYSLNTSSWKSPTIVSPSGYCYENPSMPFNKGTCFFWGSGKGGILCFDFSSEMLGSISLPCADCNPWVQHMSVVHDKIACLLSTKDYQTEMWVFNEYGTVNETWTKLHTVNTYSIIDKRTPIKGVSVNGNYIFFKSTKQMCRFNVVTKEINCFTLENIPFCHMNMVEFKESLVSVEEGNNAPICINRDSEIQK